MNKEYKQGQELENPVKKNLQDQFKQMKNKKKKPVHLSVEIVNTLSLFRFFLELFDLFTSKYTEVGVNFVELIFWENEIEIEHDDES